MTSQRQDRRKGMVLIITALMLLMVLPMVGLAIDAGVLYSVKARLSASVDAAALAAARALSNGHTAGEQEASANDRAHAFFDANFPEDHMDTASRTVTVTVAETAYRTRTVTVSAEVTAPLYFMRLLGFNNTTVVAMGRASRRDVNLLLVLDRSGSLATAGACDDLRNAAASFVDLFAEGRDRLGMITYGGAYRVDFTPSLAFKTGSPSLITQINSINCTGWTGSSQGLWKGYEELVNLAEPGALNVIVFFTDGIPNAITADFYVKTLITTTLPLVPSRCYDFANNKSYVQLGWNPVNQRYRGFIAGQSGSGRDGVLQHTAGAIPVSGESNLVIKPVGYESSPVSPLALFDCYYRSIITDVHWDIAYYPNADLYGNSVFSTDNYKPITVYPSGHAYAGKVRIDSLVNQQNAAINAVDNAAKRIRNRELNANISVMVFAIGLGGAGEAEHTLLQRIANDPASSIFDQTKPEGLYVYAPTATQLGEAFSRIASEILRFSL